MSGLPWIDAVDEALASINWSDRDEVQHNAPLAVDALAHEVALRGAPWSDDLRIERFPNFYKIVLCEHPTGASLRLHYFPAPGSGSRHSHRWPFCARILVGSLRHTIFEDDETYETREPGTERPVMVRNELPGNVYVLWPYNVHLVETLSPAVTLVLRGPATRDTRFVDVAGVERGWARRYARPDIISGGDRVRGDESVAVRENVARLLQSEHLRATPEFDGRAGE